VLPKNKEKIYCKRFRLSGRNFLCAAPVDYDFPTFPLFATGFGTFSGEESVSEQEQGTLAQGGVSVD
jgi:hypothetical protein